MTLFFILLLKITPLYINILLGYLSVKILQVKKESIAKLIIYIITPIVVFSSTISVKIDLSLTLLPIFFYVFTSLTAIIVYNLFKKQWPDATSNILAFNAGTGNTGYFGIPLAVLFFEPHIADIYIFIQLAFIFYGNTTGFYITAKGNFTVKESLRKVFRLPIIYAFIFGLVCNLYGIKIPEELFVYTSQFKAVYGILGMMILGMGLVGLRKSEDLDKKFIFLNFFFKYVYWPLMVLLFIYLDKTFLYLINDEQIYKVMFLFSIVPIANNGVTLAIINGIKPEKATLTVLLSTIFSMVYIPIMIVLYGGF
ncbi:transporter [Malaciobacter halophilus]|uniref:Transporter n=1 Tax=Malaciobacter halophilus TaxID=197482 RepID=A0A2N1IZQ6_9BACT|nr:AEC family transporter [Malaciobacter halophilus]AXH08676.1 putative permease [Malaciobacter halophilus]PKI79781.1 transporter [Malaciobacter halophilus]